MSTKPKKETPPSAPAARKRAVKKAAAAEMPADEPKAEKKNPARKTAAKKAAKSAPAGDIAPASSPSPAPAKKASRTRKAVAPEPSTPAPAPSPEAPPRGEPEPPRDAPRFGRVPGGGPITHREPNENPAPRQQTPAETAAPPPAQGQEIRHPEDTHRHPTGDPQPPREGQPRESRSKRRREKRKRRNNDRQQQQGHGDRQPHRNQGQGGEPFDPNDRRPAQLTGPPIPADGMLELAPKGFGFLRIPGKNFEQARDDVFVTPETIRKYHLRVGQWIHGTYQQGARGPQLVEITSINGMTPADASKLPHFDELKAINPTRRISFETTPERFTTRVLDIMAPVGRGQRGLIVSPPRSGKTTMLLHMAEAIREKYDEAIHLMVLLVDERPEEVTEFRRALPGAEIYASSNDEQARNHCRIAELAIERAKRLVEAGQDVFLLMDSITRLARAYNNNMPNRGRGTGSGGITIGALEVPRRLFAAARNTRGGGSLTILATALIQTNSRADEAIFMEFKGTGNMELVLDRKIAENYIYPAVDIFKSGTRREEILIPEHMLHKIHLIRRGLSGHRPVEAMERLLFFLRKFPNNPQMLMEIKG